VQLAQQRIVRRFAGLDLAAGEFPKAGVEGSGRALAEQEFSGKSGATIRRLPFDDGGGDFSQPSFFLIGTSTPSSLRSFRRNAGIQNGRRKTLDSGSSPE